MGIFLLFNKRKIIKFPKKKNSVAITSSLVMSQKQDYIEVINKILERINFNKISKYPLQI